MFILKIIDQIRRDFTAIYKCEHCGHEYEGKGYDDSYYHEKVVPNMKCPKCNKKASEDYRPRTTKYPDSQTI